MSCAYVSAGLGGISSGFSFSFGAGGGGEATSTVTLVLFLRFFGLMVFVVDLPAVDLPAVDLPAVDFPAVDLPAEDLAVDLVATLAAAGGGDSWGSGGGGGSLAARGGGECGGRDEGGEIDVMSTEGDRGRLFAEDDWELGDGVSSGGGGGGRTKWKVREAIWICDLCMISQVRYIALCWCNHDVDLPLA